MLKLRTTILIFLCIVSCDNTDDTIDCTNVLPPASNFLLKFEDAAGNSLIGTTYAQDSFKLFNPNSTLYLKPFPSGPIDELVVWMPDIAVNETYFLELSATDTDTLVIEHSQRSTPCFTFRELNTFIYNDDLLFDNDETGGYLFVILKE